MKNCRDNNTLQAECKREDKFRQKIFLLNQGFFAFKRTFK